MTDDVNDQLLSIPVARQHIYEDILVIISNETSE